MMPAARMLPSSPQGWVHGAPRLTLPASFIVERFFSMKGVAFKNTFAFSTTCFPKAFKACSFTSDCPASESAYMYGLFLYHLYPCPHHKEC